MLGWRGRGPVRQGGSGENTTLSGQSVYLVLYKYDSCAFCQRVFRAIDELGLAVEYRDVQTDSAYRRELHERTGRTTVPCLIVDGEAMFESSDIVAWLRGQFAE